MPAGLHLYLPSQAARITTGEIGTGPRTGPATVLRNVLYRRFLADVAAVMAVAAGQ